jgi:phenylacetate-coenzyme A ligase PaaK-like adenylate-forming protein
VPRKTPLESWIAGKIGLSSGELTRRKVAEYQLDKLRETIRWVRTQSPFYARHLSAFSETQVTSLDDFRRLPLTDASDLRENGLRLLCVSLGDINRVVTLDSSGTSGDPKRVFFTAEDQQLTVDFFQAGMSTLVNPGESVLIALPGNRQGTVGDLLATALRRLGARPIAHGLVSDPAATVEIMKREQVECVVGVPIQILSLVRCGGPFADVPSRHLKRVLLCSDHVADSVACEIKKVWDCEVFEHYGMTEMGLGGGVDCEAHSGYHLREADLYFEVVDVNTGAPAAAGQLGEIVFTTLTRRGMPFVRYRTGDISRFLPERCPCGTVLQRLDRVRMRKGGRVRVGPDSEITMATLDEALFGVQRLKEFTATVVHGRPSTLIVTAVAFRQDDLRQATVHEALDRVPAIHSAEQSGDLEVVVKVADSELPVCIGKRKIVEQLA